MVVSGCKDVSSEQRQREIERSKFAAKEYAVAVKQANNNEPTGFLKLYEIARNDDIYTTEYSEVAEEELFLLLYSKTTLWVKTFSEVDFEEFKAFVKGIEVSRLPKGVVSEEQFKEDIFNKLGKIKGDKKEMKVIDYILGLYNRKRH